MEFACRICGNNNYTEIMGGMFKCNGCSVLFSDVNMFSKPDEVPLSQEEEAVPSRPMHSGAGLRFVTHADAAPIASAPPPPDSEKQIWGRNGFDEV